MGGPADERGGHPARFQETAIRARSGLLSAAKLSDKHPLAPLGRGWLATGVLISRGESGEGVYPSLYYAALSRLKAGGRARRPKKSLGGMRKAKGYPTINTKGVLRPNEMW